MGGETRISASEYHHSLHDFDKSCYLKGFSEVLPQDKIHTETIHQLLFHKCGRILDILTEKRNGFEKFGQKMKVAHRETRTTQNFLMRDNESQLFIMIEKILIASCTVK